MTVHQLLLILWARRRLIGLCFGVTVGLTLLLNLLMPRQYTATASVVVDVKSPDPIAGMVLPGLMAPGYMATQSDIIKSERVAQRVVTLLHLDRNPDLRAQWESAAEGRGTLVGWIAGLLERNLDVQPSRESNVIAIEYAGRDPAMSAAVANAFAKAYIDTTIELKVEPARQYATWFDTQLQEQRTRLEKAQAALSDYQQQHGIVVTDEKLDAETQRLSDLTAQLTQIEAEASGFSSKQKTRPAALPEVIQSPLVNDLKGEIARRESKLKELSATLGPNHPQYRSAQADLDELRARLNKEIGLIAASIDSAGKASHRREQDVRAAIGAQKQKLLELRKQRDEISVLMRDVEAAQTAFDAVSQRMTQTRLEAQSAQTNVSVLTPASEPLLPSKPHVARNLAIAAFLGTLMGIAAALAVELGRRRIRSAEYLGQCLGVPVLVELDSTRPRDGGYLSHYLLSFTRPRNRLLTES